MRISSRVYVARNVRLSMSDAEKSASTLSDSASAPVTGALAPFTRSVPSVLARVKAGRSVTTFDSAS